MNRRDFLKGIAAIAAAPVAVLAVSKSQELPPLVAVNPGPARDENGYFRGYPHGPLKVGDRITGLPDGPHIVTHVASGSEVGGE